MSEDIPVLCFEEHSFLIANLLLNEKYEKRKDNKGKLIRNLVHKIQKPLSILLFRLPLPKKKKKY
jgi:hypothetical protein